jgi:hypothetical protein
MKNPNEKDKTPTSTKFAITNELQINNLEPQMSPSEIAILIYLQLRQTKNIGAATRENIINDTHLSSQNIDRALIQLQTQGKIKHITLATPPATLKSIKKSQSYLTTQTAQHQQLHKLA